MKIKLHDSLSGQIKQAPDKNTITFYACGITPYASPHIGHARSFIVFDAMRSLFENAGYSVRFVRNITDIDDKIIKAAKTQKKPWNELSEFYARENREIFKKFGVRDAEEPRASTAIPSIIKMIETLIQKGHAYVSGSDVLFDSATYQGKGLVITSTKQAPSRVLSAHKKEKADFVLWKGAKPDEPFWESPWGNGRPGWHIECSAMIKDILGETIDFHGGGVDLKFPHHHAEIKQSECAHGKPLANHWLHHGSVRDEIGRKMGKSLGNAMSAEDVLKEAVGIINSARTKQGYERLPDNITEQIGGQVVRLAMLSVLWTRPLNYSHQVLHDAFSDLETWMSTKKEEKSNIQIKSSSEDILYDNFNTPKWRAHMHMLSNHGLVHDIQDGLKMLGFDVRVLSHLNNKKQATTPEKIEILMKQREVFRQNKQFQEADKIREELQSLGYFQKDSKTITKNQP